MTKYLLPAIFLSLFVKSYAQTPIQKKDSIVVLHTVNITAKEQSPERLPEVKNNVLFSGKKNEVIQLDNINGNFATNNAREIFSRVPGVTVWENEGSGIQVNIAVRGLSPNRSWEFNTRQNGYDISSDVFGYPEAYYNPPMEAVESLQIVRGGASLQFGPQFGGMLNYVLKREHTKKFSFETQTTVGSYDMISSYNAIGGNYKKWSYYLYNDIRSGNGWRKNNRYNVRNTHAFVAYRFTEKTKLSAEYTNMDYKMQQPGGLTDAQFEDNPRQSLRERNWFGTPWNVFALQLDTQLSDHLTWNTKFFGLVSQRNSVGFTSAANTPDAINPATDSYANRRVDRDHYENFGLETRSIYKFNLGKIKNNLAFGVRAYQAKTQRQQEGKGTTGSGYDLSIEGDFARDLDFKTQNLAFFAENQFKVTEKLSITPGLRYENIRSEASGQFGVNAGNPVWLAPTSLKRSQPLFGLGLEYKLRTTNFYTNISQAYRPVLFSDLTPPAVTDVIDPNLKDADGFNADLGYRGTYKKILNFDLGVFYLSYNNRIGGVRQFVNNDPTQGTYLYRTNLGETISKGIESFVNVNITELFGVKKAYGNLDAFASMSFIDARYTDFKTYTTSGTAPDISIQESNLSGNRVENAPRYIHSFGLSWGTKAFSTTLQYRLSGKIYTDANNTENPSANGTTGLLDGYRLLDWSAEYQFLNFYNIKAGINNLSNESYATRRSGGYPGPGILPGDARTFYLSLGMKL
ncbi:TonB-dependent receptor [Flavobacterium sp. CYK-4]|uniref:TonB-dependent receptor family protein n=1 Tax=Flavobacterium lotistagni TaxID=2709660 RepID=UPI00140AC37C|nr:TonB-dependent receptor [Flavobacterium lotistagni]NHM06662.1 TonB-dependent receptor [Flavobacterium lotistagni]